MAVAKNKKKIVKKPPKITKSRLARSKEFSRKSAIVTRRTILTVIILAMLTVILAVLFGTFQSPERVVKQKIESIAADYYENYFYDKNESYATDATAFTNMMQKYVDNGFSKVTLRQLLLFDGRRHAESAAILTTYCDENETSVQFFPEEPFGKTDYRAEVTYSCIFE